MQRQAASELPCACIVRPTFGRLPTSRVGQIVLSPLLDNFKQECRAGVGVTVCRSARRPCRIGLQQWALGKPFQMLASRCTGASATLGYFDQSDAFIRPG